MDSSGEVVSVEQTPPRFLNNYPMKQTFLKFDDRHSIIYWIATASQSAGQHINYCFEVQNQFC